MGQEGKTRYTESELSEFEALILDKVAKAKNELSELKRSLQKGGDSGEDITNNSTKVLEDGADTLEKENLNQLAARQQKFINNLENALIRIKNGTYGICVDTGKLISKERLMAVPHTMHSIEAKLSKRK
jgi:DnaK suppressor protein